jgi:CelD/BcsL family acetyltransferase involved in cellulose biosynthesis
MPAFELQVIRSPEAMATMAEEWDGLAERCRGYLLSQTHQWATAAWHAVARTRGRDLAIVAGRAQGRLVAVWPLASYSDRGVRVVRPLGSEASEYCAPLIEAGFDHERTLVDLWRGVATIGDVVNLPHLDVGSTLAKVAVREGRFHFADQPVRAPYVAWRDHADWPSYLQTVSTSHHSGLRRKRRRLAKLGEITFAREPASTATGLIEWLLEHKRVWMDRRGLCNPWLDQPDFREFLCRSVSNEGAMGSLSLFVLRVDGAPVAAQLSSVDRTRVEFLIGAHDAAFAACSPGEIATEECLRWAFERRLDYDFRVGDEAYKFAWTKRWRDTASLRVATGLRGTPFIAALHARDQVRRLRFRLGFGRFIPSRRRARSGHPASTDR